MSEWFDVLSLTMFIHTSAACALFDHQLCCRVWLHSTLSRVQTCSSLTYVFTVTKDKPDIYCMNQSWWWWWSWWWWMEQRAGGRGGRIEEEGPMWSSYSLCFLIGASDNERQRHFSCFSGGKGEWFISSSTLFSFLTTVSLIHIRTCNCIYQNIRDSKI